VSCFLEQASHTRNQSRCGSESTWISIILVTWIRIPHPHQIKIQIRIRICIKLKSGSGSASDPHQNYKLDPEPDLPQFADDKPKSVGMEYEPI
jgi:hypothetical protein